MFLDPLALTIFDEGHSETEERWATLGQTENGQCMVVIHTFQQTAPANATIHIISARRATIREIKYYQERPR